MAQYCSNAIQLNFNPDIPSGTKVSLNPTPMPLMHHGFNLPVEISTASVYRKEPNPEPLATITIIAHFDTGASKTSIDVNLASHLKIIPVGMTPIATAGGVFDYPNYTIDLNFPNTNLMPFKNLEVGSCNLRFDIPNNDLKNFSNFGLLIGRDIMARWNIVWNGPTSTILISD